ncbi:hypothetical protein JMJ35_000819 [Cladonia borealis]|uniref:dolichol kinase n=1 Tax=Cladonia borealis TaxID=184061 RepID=A0AA39R9Z4_9LECA|nr:hypothetical protein JMJ35_000819 [Cladonia borealis]
MPGDNPPLLKIDAKEHTAPDPTQRLSRSPHPYHRNRDTVLQDDCTNVSAARRSGFSRILSTSQAERGAGATYFDADHRKRRRNISSPSESGTEADDEKSGSLLRLPAPPARLRKGLKGLNSSGTASPLLTPSYLDEEPRRLGLESRKRRRESRQSPTHTDEETVRLKEKFVRRRRAELIRRVSETILLGSVGFISCNHEIGWLMRSWAKELLAHAGVILAFEPAPLLYPTLIPVFVALSLMHANSESPQAVILKSLLWLGGLSVFVLCGKVLSWGVALARIPSWRFRQPKSRTREDSVIVSAVDDCLNGRLSRWVLTAGLSDDSDSDDLERLSGFFIGKDFRSQFSVDAQPSQGRLRGQRRYTLPSYGGTHPGIPPKQIPKRNSISRLQTIRSWSFRSLIKAQAVVIKWTFAIYVYSMVIAVIAFGVRPYVSRKALHDQEPIGWALGYLFGEIPLFRAYVVDCNLADWIRLPPGILDHSSSLKASSWTRLNYSNWGAANVRLLICGYCLVVIAGGLAAVFRLSSVAEVDTRRKVFHGMMVAMFLPTIFLDPTFVSLALILILAIFLLLDLFRASQLPPLSKPLTYFLAPYVDGRDHRGPVIVSHIFLLIGCAIPLWLSLAAVQLEGEMPWEGWDVVRREVSMVSGVICVGMGDAAASLIGRRFGRRRWCWSGGKSLEGSLAFAIAVVLGLSFAKWWLQIGGWNNNNGDSWSTTLGKACIAATGASLTEAVLTGGNDNVIVPVILWLLVRGLRI